MYGDQSGVFVLCCGFCDVDVYFHIEGNHSLPRNKNFRELIMNKKVSKMAKTADEEELRTTNVKNEDQIF